MALFQALCLFCLLPGGFRNAMLREVIAPLMGESPEDYKPGKMTYDLRRLKLHGIIEKSPTLTAIKSLSRACGSASSSPRSMRGC
jgi:hypothetical protein